MVIVYIYANLNNGEDDVLFFPLGPLALDTRLRGSGAGVYAHFTPYPPNKYEKLHNLDFSTFSKLINKEKNTGHRVILTIFYGK